MTHHIAKQCLRSLFLTGLFWSSVNLMQGQVNILVGYKPVYQNPTTLNGFIADYNSTLPSGTATMPPQHWLHGLRVGFRYKLAETAFEASYDNAFNTRVVRSRNTNGELVREKVLNVQQVSYGLGLMQYFGMFGFGGSIDYLQMNNSFDDYTSSQAKFELKRNGFSSHFYLAFEADNGGMVAVSLRPYMQLMWSDINLYPLANRLAPDVHNQPLVGNYDYRYPNFGIMIVLCNGPQQ